MTGARSEIASLKLELASAQEATKREKVGTTTDCSRDWSCYYSSNEKIMLLCFIMQGALKEQRVKSVSAEKQLRQSMKENASLIEEAAVGKAALGDMEAQLREVIKSHPSIHSPIHLFTHRGSTDPFGRRQHQQKSPLSLHAYRSLERIVGIRVPFSFPDSNFVPLPLSLPGPQLHLRSSH
jgi:hypothetical protein